MKRFLLRWYSQCKDALFPIRCLGCQQEGFFFCETCSTALSEQEIQECPVCRSPYARGGSVCKLCRKKTALDGMLVATPYKNRLVEHLIHTLKYRFIEALAEPLAKILIRSLNHHSLPLPDLILPVPLHPKRLRYRGFNQAELIAQALEQHLTPGLNLNLYQKDILIRVRFTKPQMQTSSRQERLENLAGAFQVVPQTIPKLRNKEIWLIDDVTTTGTTLEECAKVLKAAGVKSVWGIVVAR